MGRRIGGFGTADRYIAAMDFFAVEAVTITGLVRYFVQIVVELQTRRREIAGIVHQPNGRRMVQVARNLTDVAQGFLPDGYHVIHDCDPLYTAEFRPILGHGGVKSVRLPANNPNLNAYAERFVGSIKKEYLNRIVPLGEAHLRYVVRKFVAHYHQECNHQGLDNQLLLP